MYRPHTPQTARPVYATGPSPPYYDYATTSTPKAADYNHTLVYTRPTPSHRRVQQLPPVSPASLSRWTRLRSINNPAQMSQYKDPRLNVNAPEFHPSLPFRPASARSVSSSSSSSASSSASTFSSATSATSMSWGDESPPRTARPALCSTPALPDLDIYPQYREKLRTDVSATITSILDAGVASYEQSHNMANLVSRLNSYAPADFEARVRAEGLGMFDVHWQNDNGPWCAEHNLMCQYLTSRGVNIAAFMGSLFRYDLISGDDVHHCLDMLLSGGLHFMKLQAAHALVVHCGAGICAGQTGIATARLRRRLEARGPDGKFVWGPHDESHVLLEDLLDNLDRWFASHEMAQILRSAHLANHGYLPHDGENFTIDQLMAAALAGFNLNWDPILLAANFGLLTRDNGSSFDNMSLDALAIPGHRMIEHDASISRNDFGDGTGDNFHLNETALFAFANAIPGQET
ncbi:hypothetical protein B0H19DRAFT_1270585 [Mycena capillaripes]|nr:hypothetical protein B0H19DRAFT_1270585 [Mycena capillaripes]